MNGVVRSVWGGESVWMTDEVKKFLEKMWYA